MASTEPQFFGQFQGGCPLGNALENQDQLRTRTPNPAQGGICEEMKSRPTDTTLVFENGSACPIMGGLVFGERMAQRAAQTARVEQLQEPLISGLFGNDWEEGEFHGNAVYVRLAKDLPPEGRMSDSRLIECVFGEVYERRLVESTDEGTARFPLDAQLNVPPERYSLGVRQQVAHAATSQPVGAVVVALMANGVQVPKRQAQQLVERAALDVDAFYALPEHRGASNDTDADGLLLVGSHDATGVLVRTDALRPDTRKKAESAGGKPKGDPTETAGVRRHSHRMAYVSAVWDQAPTKRSVDDTLAHDKAASPKLPRPLKNAPGSDLLARREQKVAPRSHIWLKPSADGLPEAPLRLKLSAQGLPGGVEHGGQI